MACLLIQPSWSLYDVIEIFTKHDGVLPVVDVGVCVDVVDMLIGEVPIKTVFVVIFTCGCVVVMLFIVVAAVVFSNGSVLGVVFVVVSLGLACVYVVVDGGFVEVIPVVCHNVVFIVLS